MLTPARMWRSWIASCASAETRASATRSLMPSTSLGSSTTWASTTPPSALSRSSTWGRYSSPWAFSALKLGSAPRRAP